MGVWGTNDGLLSTVPIVGNYPLAGGDHVLEALAEDLDVRFASREGTIHPNKSIIKDRDSKLVVDTCLVELMRVKLGVLGQSGVFGLIDTTMHTIH
jgi:hypothetical protein